MEHRFENIQSYEDLESRLRDWGIFGEAMPYDVVGMMHLLGACLDNLEANCSDDELNAANYLADKSISFLIKLAERAQIPPDH